MAAGDQAIHAVIAGTAGHIDHGKSSLVRALTGIDPDRLPEEKERGLTIDLGFANLRLPDGRRIGIVDVPGHERFVRHMVAGSTSIDVAILVVAADDGVMPQTREHIDILQLLGVRRGLVALTKVDMADEETILLAEEDVREALAGTALAEFDVLRVSSVTGVGLPELHARLAELAAAIEPRPASGPFRMSIQRVFSLQGIGTVVTGIPASGTVEPGHEVEFLPGEQRSRVRALHAYGRKVQRAVAGHSTALSVPDADIERLQRGMVAAEPGVFAVGSAVDVELRVLPGARTLEHRTPVRFHSGTVEIQGLLVLLDRERLEPGSTVVARVLLEEDACVVHGDRFLLRQQNPVRTVGGGSVLRLAASAGRYRRAALGQELRDLQQAGSSPEAQVLKHLAHAGPAGRSVAELATIMSVDAAAVADVVRSHPEVHFHAGNERAFAHEFLAQGVGEILSGVERMLKSKPLAASVAKASLRTSRTLPQPLLDAALEELERTGKVRAGAQGRIVFVDRLQALPPQEAAVVERVCAACEAAQLRPPAVEEIGTAVNLGGDALQSALQRAQDEGRVVRVGDHYYAHSALRRAMRAVRDNCLAHAGELDIPQLRDHLETSRKYLIPLLEHLDAVGLTRLRGGVRVLLPASRILTELDAL
ncbi:MAG: selenocysteine-specific translation elongation factor [Planctomycetota bacterium]